MTFALRDSERPLSSADLTHRRSGRPLGGVLPIIGVIFGLGLLAGAILHPPAGIDPFATAARERGAFSWSRYRFVDFNPQATYPAEVLRVIDGDTFDARVRIWSVFEVHTRVRLRALTSLGADPADVRLLDDSLAACLRGLPRDHTRTNYRRHRGGTIKPSLALPPDAHRS